MVLTWWIPPQIGINHEGMWPPDRIRTKDIKAIRLVFSQTGHPLLQVVGPVHTLTFGIAKKIDVDQLEALARQWFPEALVERG